MTNESDVPPTSEADIVVLAARQPPSSRLCSSIVALRAGLCSDGLLESSWIRTLLALNYRLDVKGFTSTKLSASKIIFA
jgi:hypothetical protein